MEQELDKGNANKTESNELSAKDLLYAELLLETIPERNRRQFMDAIGDVLDPNVTAPVESFLPQWLEGGWDVFLANNLLFVLRKLGVEKVTVTYSGGGDSGDSDEFAFAPEIDGKQPFVTMFGGKAIGAYHAGGMNLEEVVNDITWTILGKCAGDGWYNNEGGRGSVVFDVVKGHALVDHTEFFSKSDSGSVKFRSKELPKGLRDLMASWRRGRHPLLTVRLYDLDGCDVHCDADVDEEEPKTEALIEALKEFAIDQYMVHPEFEDASEDSFSDAGVTMIGKGRIALDVSWCIEESEDTTACYSLETLESVDADE